MKKIILFFALVFISNLAIGQPPAAPEGYEWVVVSTLTDEFNDDTVDVSKWYKYNPSWVGRQPGQFKEAQVSESGGFLHLKNKKAADVSEDVWVHNGFLASRQQTFVSGMYSECRIKAAKDGTVTGFWMSKPGHSEIDVQEAVGFAPNGNTNLSNLMRMNTHYYPNGWATDIETPKTSTIGSVGDNFHVYSTWWKDDRNLTFYHNGTQVAQVETGGAFDQGMQININTECQTWLGDPIPARLNDDTLNTTEVDYVRTWQLVPIGGGTNVESELLFDGSSGPDGQGLFRQGPSFDSPGGTQLATDDGSGTNNVIEITRTTNAGAAWHVLPLLDGSGQGVARSIGNGGIYAALRLRVRTTKNGLATISAKIQDGTVRSNDVTVTGGDGTNYGEWQTIILDCTTFPAANKRPEFYVDPFDTATGTIPVTAAYKVQFDNIEVVDVNTLSSKSFEIFKVSVYPNPTTDRLTISTKEQFSSVRVYDITGKTVKTFNNTKVLNVSNLKTGLYFFKTDTGLQAKFIKN